MKTIEAIKPVNLNGMCKTYNEVIHFYFSRENFHKGMEPKRMGEIIDICIKSQLLSAYFLKVCKNWKNEQAGKPTK